MEALLTIDPAIRDHMKRDIHKVRGENWMKILPRRQGERKERITNEKPKLKARI